MQKNIPEIEELVKLISKLPGLGPKSAKRIILKLINNNYWFNGVRISPTHDSKSVAE